MTATKAKETLSLGIVNEYDEMKIPFKGKKEGKMKSKVSKKAPAKKAAPKKAAKKSKSK